MKKIIDGVRYDSSKAIKVGEYDNLGSGADSRSDFNYWEAVLYRTPRSGRFFIVGEGGPQTRFSQSAGQNSWTGGDDLIPMSKQEALQWAERYLEPAEIEEHFSDMIEDA
ncbi:MAG: hypothetical protein U5L00_06710 [Desulfovermiculus sp.]|nr:hypothetical protein [Desulfovermiculus sp.]